VKKRLVLYDTDQTLLPTLEEVISFRSDVSFEGYYGGRTGLDALVENGPDILFADLMLLTNGSTVAELMSLLSETRIILLVSEALRRCGLVLELLRRGACGCICKSATPEEIRTAVDAALDGAMLISPSVATALQSHLELTQATTSAQSLNEREREVMRAVSHGRKEKEIASELGITVESVQSHSESILRKLGARSKAEAIRKYFRQSR
jgi:DNA-binding NarL/FixJ family response regulator